MKKQIILAGILACMSMGAQAQDASNQEPKGKAIVQVFGSFNTGFGAENNSTKPYLRVCVSYENI